MEGVKKSAKGGHEMMKVIAAHGLRNDRRRINGGQRVPFSSL
jgi:hypothetical protein